MFLYNICEFLRLLKLAVKTNVLKFKCKYFPECIQILNILYAENYIAGYNINKSDLTVTIYMKHRGYHKPQNVIRQVFWITKRSQKKYLTRNRIKYFYKYYTPKYIMLTNTQKGILTLKECFKQNIGGELIAIIS